MSGALGAAETLSHSDAVARPAASCSVSVKKLKGSPGSASKLAAHEPPRAKKMSILGFDHRTFCVSSRRATTAPYRQRSLLRAEKTIFPFLVIKTVLNPKV